MGAKPSTPTSTPKRKRKNTQPSAPSYSDPKLGLSVSPPDKPDYTAQAMDHEPTDNARRPNHFNEQECEQWFQCYADEDNQISPEGIQRFFEDLGLSVQDKETMVLIWKMGLTSMEYITKDEWIQGMQSLGAHSIEGLREKRGDFERVLHDSSQFKDMYRYVFLYVKKKDEKCIDVETAIALWAMLLTGQFPGKDHFVDDLASFLRDAKPVRAINKDQWQSFYEFINTISDDLSNYDETSAWPVLLDEFVEWKKQQQ